jgi:hypothetical protein
MLDSVNHSPVVETLDWFFHASVRNTFVHADYTLHDDQFRSRSEWFVRDGVRTSELPRDVLADLVNRALTFHDAFMREHDEQRGGYRTNKTLSAASGAARRETRSNSLRTPSAAYTASARRPGTRPRRTRRRSGPFTRPPPTGPSDTTPVFKGVG